ncbi:MAG: ATP-binding protein [Oscillospiraceae bacterium]|nr:ATP-binding protein [Oscillospiraceae bacterium]
MADMRFIRHTGRKIIVTGHYGSGKTEFAVSLAMQYASLKEKIAVVDLDIINPYFRSRERREMFENSGVSVYGSTYDYEITAELPAIGAKLRAPLEDKDSRVIIDVGGNDAGAMVLNQYTKYFTDDDTTMLVVVNSNRPETATLSGALDHIKSIEDVTGLQIDAVVNNSHMLSETTAQTIINGYDLCLKICAETNKFFYCSCFPAGIVDPEQLTGLYGHLIPMGLHMRPAWLKS